MCRGVSALVRLVECQSQAQGGIDLLHLVEGHVPHEIAETFWCDGSCLFGEDLRPFVADGDRWPKYARCRGPGRGHDEDGRQQQVVGLDDHRISCASLFASACATGGAQAVDVTAHAGRPSP
jgi:hypothetical protein